MADFRRWFTVLAVLALFAGLASAQVSASGGTGSMLCTTGSGAVTPQIRAEGYTELVGDIVITCTGGDVVAPSQTALPTTNIVVSFGALAVTSRILSNPNNSGFNASEALLMVDEPNSNLGGPVTNFGSRAGLKFCATPLTGCAAYPTVVPNDASVNTVVETGIPYSGVQANNGTLVNAANVFQGITSGNTVTFFGVPILPPATSGVARVFRITNVRVNANGFAAGAQVQASISTNGSTSLPIQPSTLTVGYVTNGLQASVSKSNNSPYQQCLSVSVTNKVLASNAVAATLSFKELFGTAFKTRVFGSSTAGSTYGLPTFGGAADPTAQNVPGRITNSESGFVYNDPALVVPSGGTTLAGLADYGTRLKAVFSNIPAGVTLYVSTTPVASNSKNLTAPTVGIGGTNPTTSWAVLVSGQAVGDGTGGNNFPSVTSTATDTNGTPVVALSPAADGTATAVWEVTNTIPNTQETLYFNVYAIYTANPGANNPAAPATGVANLSYAPTPTVPFTAAQGAAASSTLPIPRFADTSTATPFMTTTICQTALLWPYIVNGLGTGLDTGLAIANTTKDPFGTTPQAGTCTISFYGNATVADFPVPSIAGGTVYANNLQNIPGARNFQGYAIGVCNFQYAHGYAAITDLSLSNFVSSYLALVMNPSNINGLTRSSNLGIGEVFVH